MNLSARKLRLSEETDPLKMSVRKAMTSLKKSQQHYQI